MHSLYPINWNCGGEYEVCGIILLTTHKPSHIFKTLKLNRRKLQQWQSLYEEPPLVLPDFIYLKEPSIVATEPQNKLS